MVLGDVVNGKVLEGNVTSDGVVSAEVMTTLVTATVSDGDGSGRDGGDCAGGTPTRLTGSSDGVLACNVAEMGGAMPAVTMLMVWQQCVGCV